jgi:hypothetical protein
VFCRTELSLCFQGYFDPCCVQLDSPAPGRIAVPPFHLLSTPHYFLAFCRSLQSRDCRLLQNARKVRGGRKERERRDGELSWRWRAKLDAAWLNIPPSPRTTHSSHTWATHQEFLSKFTHHHFILSGCPLAVLGELTHTKKRTFGTRQ